MRKAVMPSSSLLSLLFYLTLTQVSGGELLLEEGYAVTTVIYGDKVKVNPELILAQYGSPDFVLLDSSASTFYTVSFPSPQESVIKKLTGNGVAGYKDGDLGSALFNKPESFTVDFNGNIYVADRHNHTIRKISKSGVTTIAGGYTQKSGNIDGPSQNATFSDDFELTFAPMQCALMISDHGNRLVRQINLKAEDCKRSSENVLGTTSAWILTLLVSCLLGFAIGFVVRPYVIRQGGQGPHLHLRKETWKHFLIQLGRQAQTFYFDIRSAVVSSHACSLPRTLFILSLSHLALIFRSLMFSSKVVAPQTSFQKPVSLLYSDQVNSQLPKSQMVADELRNLITFDEDRPISDDADTPFVQDERPPVSQGSNSKIDNMIRANIKDFAQQAPKPSLAEYSVGSLGLVKRRSK